MSGVEAGKVNVAFISSAFHSPFGYDSVDGPSVQAGVTPHRLIGRVKEHAADRNAWRA